MVDRIIGIVGAVVGIVGIVLAVFLYYKGKEKKEFSYSKKTNRLIECEKSKFEKLAITYDGKSIENLTVSKVTIWNSGNKLINKNDIVESKELSISASGDSKILDIGIIACTDETNKFVIYSKDEHNAKIDFDYADKNGGIVVQVIHTGTDKDIDIDCKIKGGKPIKKCDEVTHERNFNLIRISTAFLYPIVVTISVVSKILYDIIFNNDIDIFFVSILFLLSVLLLLVLLILNVAYPVKIPKNLRKH